MPRHPEIVHIKLVNITVNIKDEAGAFLWLKAAYRSTGVSRQVGLGHV